MTTVIEYTTLKQNDHLHYVLCYLVSILWEGMEITEDNGYDQKKVAELPAYQQLIIKRGQLWDWLCHYYPEQEITIKGEIHCSTFDTNFVRTATFDTNKLSILLSGVQFEKVDVNKQLEVWVFNF